MGKQGDSPGKVVPSLFLVADRARLLMVWEAFRGARRFSDYRRRTGLSDTVLSGRLRDLVDYGVLQATPYSDHPKRYEYELTTMGREFWRVGIALLVWQRRWGSGIEEVNLTHVPCGPISSPEFGCAACGQYGLTFDDLVMEWLTPTQVVTPANHPLHRNRKVSPTATKAIAAWGEANVVIGDRWSLNIVRQAFLGAGRFLEFQRQLSISPAQLTQRLADLVEHDFVERVQSNVGSAHHRYVVRPKSLDLLPLILTNDAWTRRWFTTLDGPAVDVVHTACGSVLQPSWWCPICHEQLRFDELHAEYINEPGPPRRMSEPGPDTTV